MFSALAAVLALACHDVAAEPEYYRCDDVTAQIEQALGENIDAGVLLPDAEPCALTPESFDPRVQPAAMEYLLEAFANACGIQRDACSGIRVPIPQDDPPEPATQQPPPPPAPPPAFQAPATSS